MNDVELLELAIKAARVAGIELNDFYSGVIDEHGDAWDPLEDDGQALRLAMKLKMQVSPGCVLAPGLDHTREAGQDDAATRRAIVRAAAQMGINK